MKLVTAIIKHQRLDEVRRALTELGVLGMSITDVKGFGRQKGHLEVYRGMQVEVKFLPKLKLELAIDDHQLEGVIAAISKAARSTPEGAIGDGKIFVVQLEDVVRIRTGETGKEAL